MTDHLYNTLYPSSTGNLIASKRQENSILTLYGLIDEKGKTLTPFVYSSLTSFNGNLIVTKKEGSKYLSGLLSEKGDEIIPIQYRAIKPISDKLLAITNLSDLIAIYQLDGKPKTDFQFEDVALINDQFLLISEYNHRGMLNKNLEMVIPPLYKSLRFNGNDVVAQPYDQWDFFKENKYNGTFYFDQVNFTSNDTFVTLAGNKTGIINTDNQHLAFLKNESSVSGNEHVFITKSRSTGRFKVYTSNGKALFQDSFDDIKLFDQVFFGKINQPDGHSWSVYNFNGKKLNLSNYQSFKKRSEEFFEARQNGKIGLIGTNGKEVSPFLYDELSEFKSGRAVAFYNDSYGIINKNGIWIMTPYFDSLRVNDRHIYFQQGSEYGVADLFGKVLYRSQIKFNIHASAISIEEEDSTLALYDMAGTRLLEQTYDSIRPLNKELLLLHRDDQYFIYRPSDKADFKLDPTITEVGLFKNGFIPIKKDKQWGLLNEEGRLVIANRYERVKDFSEGYFPIKLIGKWGVINELEEIVIQPNFDEVEPFINGLSIVSDNRKYGLINTDGLFVLEMKYSKIERFGEYFLLELNDQRGLADSNGRIIKNPGYTSVKPLSEGYFLVERNGKFGVIDKDGQDVIPSNYLEIKQSGNRFLGRKPGEDRVFRLK